MATKVPLVLVMANKGCVVLLGDFSNERLDLASIGQDFSWSVTHASDLTGLREICQSRTVLVVLVKAERGAWPQALRAVRTAAPRARIIICHTVDQADSRAAMVDAGAFGVLLSPLAHSEVRQSLGFVWASRITPLSRAQAAGTRPVVAA